MKSLLIPFVMFFNVFAAWGLFRLIFGNWETFGKCLGYWLQPDSWSWWKGEAWEDAVGEFSLFLYFGSLALLFAGEYHFFLG